MNIVKQKELFQIKTIFREKICKKKLIDSKSYYNFKNLQIFEMVQNEKNYRKMNRLIIIIQMGF